MRRHLLSKAHAAAYELRIAKENAVNMPAPRPTNLDISGAGQQHQFARPLPPTPDGFTSDTFSQARAQYFAVLEHEMVAAHGRDAVVRRRIEEVDKKYEDNALSLKETIESVRQQASDKHEELESVQRRHTADLMQAHQDCADVERRANDKFSAIDSHTRDLQNRLSTFKQIVAGDDRTSKEAEKRLERFREDISHKVSNFSGILSKNKKDTGNELDAIREKISRLKKNEIKPARFDEVCNGLTASRFQLGELDAKVRGFTEALNNVKNLETSSKEQDDRIEGLEMSLQVVKEQLQLHIDIEEDNKETLTRLESRLDEMTENLASFKDYCEERDQQLNERLSQNLQQFRQDLEQSQQETQAQWQNDIADLVTALEQ